MADTVSHNLPGARLDGAGARPRVALHEPEIAANAAAVMRLAACLDVPVEIIEPLGFVLDDRRLRRVGLDYLQRVAWRRHASFDAFEAWRQAAGSRLVLLTTRAARGHHEVVYRPGDVLLAGQESAGVPAAVAARADLAVRIPMAEGCRSLNVVTAVAIVLAEALRQTAGFPRGGPDVHHGTLAAAAPER